MPLSRLENFLRSPTGTVLYVDPGNFDATDSFENRGDSATRPFKSIQRALIEASRFSYQSGFGNDLNDRTTILVSSGTHYIDNRPGFSVTKSGSSAVFKKRTGKNIWTTDVLNDFSESSNFDIFDKNNDLYKFNSVEGGVILPRGTSIVALDLRKTKIRPLYVPDPSNPDVDRSSIFKITGNCYFTSFTFFDADLAVGAYKDYSYDLVVPKFSHHKLTAFTYADGVNKVKLGFDQTDLTDLQMYYFKVAKAYGITSGRNIPDYPVSQDIEPVIDEYRIVGVLEENLIGISSIRSGDGIGGGVLSEITVTTKDLLSGLNAPHNLSANTPILISGVEASPGSYNGSFTVKSVVGPNTFTYVTPSAPAVALPAAADINSAIIKVESDTTSSSSPYIFNCSLRSVYGMCSLWADGSKADGFKSVVVAQFTGISLQKDDNAFLLYSQDFNSYRTSSQIPQDDVNRPLHTNPYVIYNPEYENFHIKVSNNSFIQCVSIFAIGFAKHFVTETGGDMSITNSNSNFGALALESLGYRNVSFNRDDVGYITHIIPPKENPVSETTINWLPLDVTLITNGANSTDKNLYIYGYNDKEVLPSSKIDGFRIGAKNGDTLRVLLDDSTTVYSSPIYMQAENFNPTGGGGFLTKKEYKIARVGNTNNIVNGLITLDTGYNQFITGEKVRLFSDTGQVPDGLIGNTIYYVIRESETEIRLSLNYNDAISYPTTLTGSIEDISNNGGVITVVSSVSDKKPGDPGHPIQWDAVLGNWYIVSSRDSTNGIYQRLTTSGVAALVGNFTQISNFERRNETRSIEDRLYKVRYVIPKEYTDIRPPGIGFILQESKTVGITTRSVTSASNLTVTDKRNERIINSITAGSITDNSQLVTVKTEQPHRLLSGDLVKVSNVKSTLNPTASGITSTFNGSYPIISIPDSHTFTYRISGVSTNPGVFSNDLNTRNESTLSSLPVASREQYKNTFVVYRVDTIKPHIPGEGGQDGIYYLTLISSNVKTNPTVGYAVTERSYNQDVRDLYPQTDRDNYVSDPKPAVSYADHQVLGRVITNDKRNSITKESTEYLLQNNIGFEISNVSLSGVGNTTVTITTKTEHKLNSIKSFTLTATGTEPDGTYYGVPVKIGGNTVDAVCNYTKTAGSVVASSVEFVDYGSNITAGTVSIGNSGTTGTVTINSNINDGLELGGFIQNDFNDIYRIVSIGSSTTITLQSSKTLPSYSSNTNSRIPFGFISSKGTPITSIQFSDISTGIATVTTSQPHGFADGNNIKIIGSGSSVYDSNFVINSVISSTSFNFKILDATTNPAASTGLVYKRTLAPNAKSSGRSGENLASRGSVLYSGISTSVSTTMSASASTITLSSAAGFDKGDYIQNNNEILRLISKPSGSTFNVERGMFGTRREEAATNSIVHKIRILPVEFRRPSFMRASGHTFEYLGYGSGNYSTSVPQKQSRRLSDDEVLTSQSRKISGGTVVYSGMNDLGEFYYGAKRVSSVTGQETTIEAPILTFTGDDADGSDDPSKLLGIFDNLLVRQKITVEGGETGEDTSVFRGPVRFENLVTIPDFKTNKFTLDDKFEKIFVVERQTETNIRKPGAISYNGNPGITINDNYIGKVFIGNSWKRWGLISKVEDNWNVDLGEVNVESLKINGVPFNPGAVGIITTDDITAKRVRVSEWLRVTGVTTFVGNVTGNNGIINVTDALRVGTGGNILTIKNNEISNVGVATLTFHGSSAPSGLQNLVQISRNSSGTGDGKAHLSIWNENPTGLSVISWRNHTKQPWLAGVDSDNNWNLALGSPSVGLAQVGFTTAVKVVMNTLGNITAPGYVDSKTPDNAGSTGGLRIRANSSNTAYLQFIDNTGSAEYLHIGSQNGITTFFGGLSNSIVDFPNGRLTAKTPSFGPENTTGGIIIKANSDNISRLQFVDSSGSSEYSNISASGAGITISTSVTLGGLSAGSGDLRSLGGDDGKFGIYNLSADSGRVVSFNFLAAGSQSQVDDAVVISGVGSVTAKGGFFGSGTIPIGGIIMWSGSTDQINSLSGWKLCDGLNGTPDLRNRFIVGASAIEGNKTGITTQIGPTFGSTSGNLSRSYKPGDTGGFHAVKLLESQIPSHSHTFSPTFTSFAASGTGLVNSQQNSVYTVITTANTGEKGGDQYHENRPYYYALAFIMRVS